MAFRDILVSMETGDAARARARFAADVAGKFGARLVGAFARSRIAPPFMPQDVVAVLTEAEIQRIYDAHAKVVEAAAEEARQTFEAAAAAEEVVSEWLVLKDSEELVACARRTDLMVLSGDAGQAAEPFTAASLAIAGGGPAIVVPAAATPSGFRRILIAWNGSREAARALHAAWPVIAMADQVDVLVVSRRGLHGPEGMLQRHLERHGLEPNVIFDESEDAKAGDVLRRQVAALKPDLVVMGLYGRSRIRELVLGGVSREMLADPPVPLLVSH